MALTYPVSQGYHLGFSHGDYTLSWNSLLWLYAYSGPSRSPIPAQADHPFRAKPITDSGASRSPFRAKPITFGTRADDGLPPRPPAG